MPGQRTIDRQRPIMQDATDSRSLIRQAFTRLMPPKGTFDPNGNWNHSYVDIGSLGLNFVQGGLSISHKAGGTLDVESHRLCPSGYRYFTKATISLGKDDLRSPTAWHVESKVSKTPTGKARLNTDMTKRATVTKGVVTIATGKDVRKIDADGPLTCKPCLMDVVGRLAAANVKELPFTMFDEYDELLPNQRLSLRGVERVPTKGGNVALTTYQHTGTATVPGMFYVDDAGRVLAYLAGMQLLILKTVNGKNEAFK